MTGFDEDFSQAIGVGVGVAKIVDPRHRHSGIERVRNSGNGSHRSDAAVAVTVDADLLIRPRLFANENSSGRRIQGLPVAPVVDTKVLEFPSKTRPASVVHCQNHVTLLSQILLVQTGSFVIRICAATVHHD